MRGITTLWKVGVFVVAAIVAGSVAYVLIARRPTGSDPTGGTLPPILPPSENEPSCKTSRPESGARCVRGDVVRVIDGDTLVVEGNPSIRLVLVSAPELSAPGGPASKDYLANLCLGSSAVVDEDDFQVGDDPYGRVLAVISCGGTNANAAMISSGHAATYYEYCSQSEFGSEAWTGCSSPPPPPPRGNCDPAYPDVCIPSPPPDLDCDETSFRNFRVLPPDPHHFDGDGDGIGCERDYSSDR